MAFSWLKVPTSISRFKTLLRPRSYSLIKTLLGIGGLVTVVSYSHLSLYDSLVNITLASCLHSVLNEKVQVDALNQEEALVGAFTVVTNLRVDFCLKVYHTGSRYCGYRMTTVCGVAGVSVPSPQVTPVSRQHWPLVTGTLAVTCLVRAGRGGAGRGGGRGDAMPGS